MNLILLLARQGLGDKTYSFLQVPSQWTVLHASLVLLVSLPQNVVLLNILVFVYYGFYAIIFLLLLLDVYLQNGKSNKRKRRKNFFHEIAYNENMQLCLTCSRGKIHEKTFFGGGGAQVWFISFQLHTMIVCNNV